MEHLKYTEILQLNKQLAGTLKGEPFKIGLLSNVTINSLKEILEYNCRIHQIEPAIEIGNFDNIVQDSAQSGSQDMVIIFYDMLAVIDDLGIYFEDVDEAVYNSIKDKIAAEIDLIYNNLKAVPSVIFNTFSSAGFTPDYTRSNRADQLVISLNQYLDERKPQNVTLIDTDKIFIQTGIKQAIDYRFYYSSKAPYTVAFLKEYIYAIQPVILRNNGKLKKALIFDCDNTLWKGVVGEEGVDGIEMSASSKQGKFYRMVQQIAVSLSEKGILIGLCSKNNQEDVDEVLQHPDMLLTNEHILIKKVNWQDKATNLRAIARELNIGLDSLVFVDDAPFEVNLIKEQIPEIVTLQVPITITDYPNQLLKLVKSYFNMNIADEDRKKTEMYKQQFEREETKKAFGSIEDYLASLEIVLTVAQNNKGYIPRVSQLTQKTNQFNLTTKRYTEGQIEIFAGENDGGIFTIFVRDKYGDSGLTGVAIVQKDIDDPKTALLDSFLMSCRVIGRNIEYVFMNYIISVLKGAGYERVTANYFPTKKNAQVADFYEKTGFLLIEEMADGAKLYTLSIDTFQPLHYEYIVLKEEEKAQ